MLVLTRRIEETLMIGDRVTVTVLQVRGDRVRLGVSAPREVQVQRAGKVAPATTAMSRFHGSR